MSSKIIIIAKGDSAASKNYWREEDMKFLTNIQPYTGPSVTLTNADMIDPSHKGSIQSSKYLSEKSREATALPALKSLLLFSLGQICNHQRTIILDKNKLVEVKTNKVSHSYNNKDVILQGHRNF